MKTFPMRILSLILAGVLLTGLVPVGGLSAAAQRAKDGPVTVETDEEVWERAYWNILDEYAVAGYAAYAGAPVNLSLETALADGTAPVMDTYAERTALVWSETVNEVAFKVTVPESALYVVELDYYAINDKSTDIQRGLLVDGESLCSEWNNLRFSRLFEDAGNVRVDVNGDESAPRMQQVYAWQTVSLSDYNGYYSGPMQLYLSAGEHTLTFTMRGNQPMALGGVRLVAPTVSPTYAELEQSYREAGYSSAAKTLLMEGEDTLYRSSASLRLEGDNDLTCEPSDYVNTKMNVVGGSSWKNSRQTITWKLDVPEDGLYRLAFHTYSYYNYGGVSYRRIEIDGAVPCAELEAYCFLPDTKWRTETLPYNIYLTAGSHNLSMSVVAGEMTPIIRQLDEDMEVMSDLYLDITLVTTSDPDPNYDYELDERVPSLIPTMKKLRDRLRTSAERLAKACGNDKALTYSEMQNTIEDMEILMEDVFEIPSNLDQFTTMLSQYGNWISVLKAGTVSIDSLQLVPIEEKPYEKQVSFWESLYGGMLSFFATFTKDYSAVIGDGVYDEEREIIDVWFGGTQIWAAEIQDLIETSFVPEHNIQIRFKLTPASQMATGINAMLLALLSGTAPDAVLSAPTISDYAMRNQCYNLKNFEDYEEIAKRFPASCLTPLTYQGKVFGLPQTMDFNLMYYRTDIFEELGLSVPNTWDEMTKTVIPKLAENSMSLAASPGYETLLFQMGGELYNEDMTESAVASQVSWKAFKKHCDFYTMYGVPKTANFFNRFRSGEQPIGFGGLATYIQFIYAAPELEGRWAVAQMPGTVREDGSIDRTIYKTLGSAAMIMAEAKHPEEAWTFLKWYTDVEPQVELSEQLEAKLDMSARLISANMEAFEDLDWDRDDLKVFQASMQSGKDYPPVLGDYYTTRYIGYAFNYVVMSKTMTEREALEYAQKNINNELLRRRNGLT